MIKALLVVISDRLSELVKKGEITARYYNPGELFNEVHILMVNNDWVNPEDVQKTVGRARLYIHNLPAPSYSKSLGWLPILMRKWIRQGIALAQKINPILIRTYNNYINGYLAVSMKRALHIPLVVSLHTNPDKTRTRTQWLTNPKDRLALENRKKLERETLRNADRVIPVYKPLSQYASKYGAKHIQVIYNVINPTHIRKKERYELHNPPRIISVGRQIPGKCPDNLIKAIADGDGAAAIAELTLIGDGEYHNYLKSVAEECGILDRVLFIPSIDNDRLCEMLSDYDIFAAHSDYWEVPKAIMEPLLTGLPTIVNRRPEPTPELNGDWIIQVENSKNGYLEAINKLLTDEVFREALGRRAYVYAQENFAPTEMEQKVVDLYKDLVPEL